VSRAIDPARVGATFRGLYTLLLNRYYVDELYMWLIDKVAIGVAAGLSTFDRMGLDGLVNGVANSWRVFGSGLRTMQTGRVQNYGLVLFAGVALIAFGLLLGPLLASSILP
jgi:NADH-quinone oxidoreductase subunit L